MVFRSGIACTRTREREARLREAEAHFASSSSEGEDEEAAQPAERAQAQQAAGVATEQQQPLAREAGSSDSSADGQRRKHRRDNAGSKRKRKKEKDKKRHKESRQGKRPKTDLEKAAELDRRAARAGDISRTSAIPRWAAGVQPGEEVYFFDTRGDRNNIAYDGLYRMDIAAYQRVDPAGVAAGAAPRYGYAYVAGLGTEGDGHLQKAANGLRQRYFLAGQVRREYDRRLRRLHLGRSAVQRAQQREQQQRRLQMPMPAFIPVAAGGEQEAKPGVPAEAEAEEPGETAEQYLMRRTKEFNVATRERPYDLQLWLDFAAFQDEHVRSGRYRKGLEAAAAEKKIAILERALGHHPGSEQLLLALLEAAATISSADELRERWERVLSRHGGSARLWREYLSWRGTQFGAFNVSSIRETYMDALEALGSEQARRQREGAPGPVREEVERALVATFTDACRFDLHSGHSERAVACLQAVLEFNCFAPAMPPGSGSAAKLRLFEAFWESGVPLLGEANAKGWATWVMRHEMGLPQHDTAEPSVPGPSAADSEEPTEAEEGGGWSGWTHLKAAHETDMIEAELEEQDAAGVQDDQAEAEPEPGEVSETEEELMARLGMRLEEQMAGLDGAEGMRADIAVRWVAEERERDRLHWRPNRALSAEAAGSEGAAGGDEEELAAESRIKFSDIRYSLIALESEPLRLELTCRCLELLGVPLSQPPSSNTQGSIQAAAYVDALPAPLANVLLSPSWDVVQSPTWSPLGLAAVGGCGSRDADQPGDQAELWDQHVAWLRPEAQQDVDAPAAWFLAAEERRQFVSSLLTQLIEGPSRHHQPFCDALLAVEAACAPAAAANADATVDHNSVQVEHARGTAKRLLAQHRDSLELWGAYARLEGLARQFKAARKVYDTALGSLLAMPQAYAQHAPVFALSYAEMELSRSQSATQLLSSGPCSSALSSALSSAATSLTRKGKGSEVAASNASSAAMDAMLRALHVLAWFGHGGVYAPYKAPGKGEAGSAELAGSELLQARKGYQAMLTARVLATDGLLDAATCALVAAAALFEQLLPHIAALDAAAGQLLGSCRGVDGAAAIFEQSLAAATLEVRQQGAAHEELQVRYLRMLTHACLAGNPRVPPKRAHAKVAAALQVYPRNAELLGMLGFLEQRAHTMSRLRLTLRAACEATSSPLLWLMAIKCEAPLPGPHRVQALFEKALACKGSRACPLLWRAYLAYELARGRADAAKRVFLRAIHICPAAKALWLDGFASLTEQMSDKERSELLDIMRDKDLRIRTDVYEVLLAAMEGTLMADQ
ncbi:hypothetical protein WJX72_009973 [[Myrmecia] bisecta]|uniref:NRDE2-like protein n=1 Tax=[Myrmecia] bisecta TaxID=41462 RepID=A0AAW1QGK2_9CHLO